ncbi:MAG TPA: hypothetical protein VGI50_14025 [Solirubrobacteraceae bacterium]|jgi:hypothetical protein
MNFQARWGVRLAPAVVASCLILTTPTTPAVSASQRKAAAPTRTTRPIQPIEPVSPKSREVPHTTRRESRAVVGCLHRAGLKPVVTSGVGFLWEGWIANLGSFVYAQYYPTLKRATREAKLLRLEESGLVHRIVISQHIAPYVGSPVPKIVKCLHGLMITKQPKKNSGHFHF